MDKEKIIKENELENQNKNENILDLKEQYEYIFQTYQLCLCQYELLKLMDQKFNPNSKSKTLEITIIDALKSSIVTNLYKIVYDTRENKITINHLVKLHNNEMNHSGNEDKMIKLKKLDNSKVSKLRTLRNSVVAHSTIPSSSFDYQKSINLFYKELDEIFLYLSKTLYLMCENINGCSFGGYNTKTGIYSDTLSKNVCLEYNSIIDKDRVYNLMFRFMRQSHKEKLLEFIYSAEN